MTNADNAFLLLEEGRKTEALEVSTHVGGGAVNAAVAMSRLGLDVGTLIKLGKDARAEMVMNHLMQEAKESQDPDDYEKLGGPSPEVIADVANWIRQS